MRKTSQPGRKRQHQAARASATKVLLTRTVSRRRSTITTSPDGKRRVVRTGTETVTEEQIEGTATVNSGRGGRKKGRKS